jgi:hypothetical protein
MWAWVKKHWKPIAAISAIVLIALFFFPESNTRRSSALFAQNDPTKDAGVQISVRADRNFAEKGEQVHLALEVRNGPSRLDNFRLAMSAPGFEWDQGKVPAKQNVPPGASMLYEVPLTAIAGSGKYSVTVFYALESPSARNAVLTAGLIELDGRYGETAWIRFFRRLSQLLKDLTLPFILAGLAYWFNRKQSDRESDRRAAEEQAQRLRKEEEDRAQRLRKEEEEKAQRRYEEAKRQQQDREQVRDMILLLMNQLTEQHYMPIVRAARLLIADWRSSKPAPTKAAQEKNVFNLLFLIKRMDYLRQTKGQIFFQNRLGESIAANAWFVLREKFLKLVGDEQMGQAIKLIGVNDGFADFSPHRLRFRKATEAFVDWTNAHPEDFEACLQLADLIQGVFRFEANRPFLEHWYGDKVDAVSEMEFEFLRGKKGDKLELLRSLASEVKVKDLTEGAQSRLEELQQKWPQYIEATSIRATQFRA